MHWLHSIVRVPNKEGDDRREENRERQSNGDSQEQDSLKLKMRNYVWAGHHNRHAVSQAAPAIEREKQQPRRTITLTRSAAPRERPAARSLQVDAQSSSFENACEWRCMGEEWRWAGDEGTRSRTPREWASSPESFEAT